MSFRCDAGDKGQAVAKAGSLALTANMGLPEAFHVIADACLRQFRRNEMLLADGNAEAVHQARVALRRLRTAFSMFQPMLHDDAFDRLKGDLKWLADTLGDVRDLDVLIVRCRDEELRAKLMTAREGRFRVLVAVLAAPRAKNRMLDLADWSACGAWRNLPGTRKARKQRLDDFVIDALGGLDRKVKKAGAELASLADAARHDLRKDVKRLRYGAQFFASLFTGKRRQRHHARFVEALGALQDRLGRLNDAAAIPKVLARAGLECGAYAAFLSDIDRDGRDMLAAAVQAYEALTDAKRFWR